jgi:hypothetical protein
MLVIVNLRRLENYRIEIGVARPQHDGKRMLDFNSEKEVREVLSIFGIGMETIDSHLKLLTQMGVNEQLTLPPMDVPQHSLLSRGFRL